jgi:poly(hydroxyalkanoate) depolymerase family esterase
MSNDFQRAMRDATRLVRSGDLKAATAAIQAALGFGRERHAPRQGVEPSLPEGDDLCVIEVDAREAIDQEALEADKPVWAPISPIPEPRDAPQRDPGFHVGLHSGASGSRPYKLFVPPGCGNLALPLVVMLHGCTQDPDDFAAGTAMNEAAAAQGFFVLYPAQTARANPQRCWSWFKHVHQERGRGEPAILAGMTQEVIARHGIDPDRVYVAGLSAGGAMAAILAEAYPDIFAAVGVHSGLAAQSASDLPSALAAMRGTSSNSSRPASGIPTIVFHGDADSTVHARNGHCVLAASVGEEAARESREASEEGGRRSTRSLFRDASGRIVAEHWVVHGGGHAWFGGRTRGSYTDPRGPDATAHMIRFFMLHRRRREG